MLPGNNGLMYQRSQLLRIIGYGMYGFQLGGNIYRALPFNSIPGTAVAMLSYSYAGNSTKRDRNETPPNTPPRRVRARLEDNTVNQAVAHRIRYSNRYRRIRIT